MRRDVSGAGVDKVMKRLNELWDKVELIPVGTRLNLFLGILSFVAVAGFFYAIGTDAGEASVLNQQCAAKCAAMCQESIRP